MYGEGAYHDAKDEMATGYGGGAYHDVIDRNDLFFGVSMLLCQQLSTFNNSVREVLQRLQKWTQVGSFTHSTRIIQRVS